MVYKTSGKAWISNGAIKLRLMIAVNAHCEEKGHRAHAATVSSVSSEYWWGDMKLDIKEFIKSRKRCIFSGHGERIPRPLSTALTG